MSSPKKASGASRREFLKGSAAAVAGAALAGSLNVARSAHAASSETLRVALIGCGGRGNGAVRDCLSVPDGNIKVVAVADAFEENAKNGAESLRRDATYKGRVDIPNDRVFVGLDAYQKAIACGVDLVLIATPPGVRPAQYKAAIEAGKHVFMEKPCCTDAPGYRTLMEANKLADQKGLKVAVGLQRRHDPRYRETIKRIQDGALGKLMYLQGYWNGGPIWIRSRKPGQTEMQYQVYNWYHFVWLSGDNICEQHVHNLDVCNWALGDQHPVEANGMGGCQVRYAGKSKGVGQIFDHHFVEYTYADGTKLYSQCRQMEGCWSNVSERAVGAKGISNCNGWIDGDNKWHYKGASVNPYQQEHVDLLTAIRKNEKLNDGWHAANSSFTAVFGRMANYSGQIVKWDDAVAKGPNEQPKVLAWNAEAPVKQDANGDYPIATPGVYKAY